MHWIVGLSLRLRFLVVILAMLVIAFGATQLGQMPVNVFPEFDPPLVEVQTEALGLSSAEVESLITVPMEADLLNGVAWVEQIYSESVSGLSSILLIFEPGTDPIRARHMVQERLTQAHALPNVSKPPVMLQPLSATGRVMMVGLSSEELSLIELGVLARWNIKPRLLGVPGVANVAIWGARERELQVQIDAAQLHENGVTLAQVIKTTGEALWVSPLSYLESSKPGTGGWIDTPNQRLGIRHLLPISSPDDLAQVAIVGHEDLLLGDVTNIVEDHQPLIGDAALTDGPGLLLVIEKFPGANILEVTKGVEDAMTALAPGLTGVDIDTKLFRPANYLERVFGNLSRTIVVGAGLGLLVLFLLMGSWRTTLIALVTIPVSLAAATSVLYLRGEPLNIMILAGLAIALAVVIDDATGNIEHLERRLYQHRQSGSTRPVMAVIQDATLELRGAILFATLILLLAVLPLYLLEGLTGAYLRPLVVTYGLTILTSLVVALLITPGLSLLLFPRNVEARSESPQVRWLQELYLRVLAPFLRAPNAALVVVIVLAVIGAGLMPLLNQTRLPALQQSDLLISWEGPPGTSRSAMTRTIDQVSQELRTIDGIRNVGSHVGRAETGDQVVGINSAEVWASIEPTADYDATVAAIRAVVVGYPGLFREVKTYRPERIGEALVGSATDLTVRIYGVDLDILGQKADEIAQAITQVDGVGAVNTDDITMEPQVEIEVNLAAAEQFGIKPGDVRRAATTQTSGIRVGNLFEDQKVFDVVVQGDLTKFRSLTDLENMLLDTPDGRQVTLSEVADIRIAPAPIVIKRDAVSRYIDVGVTLSGRGADQVAAGIRTSLQGIEFPLEYRAEVLNGTSTGQAAQQRLWSYIIAVVIGIFLLLQAAVGGWRLAGVLLIGLIAALAGCVLAAFLGGGTLTLGALFGFLAVFGVAVRSSLVTIQNVRLLEQRHPESIGLELVQQGARERLGPTLMTALTTAAVLLPLVFFGNIPGHEVLRPMAIVILGGLVTSLLINLLVVPALYLKFRPEPDVEMAQLIEDTALNAV